MITIDLKDLTTESLRKIAYLLVHEAAEAPTRGKMVERHQQAKAAIREIQSRAFGGDTSELKEMIERVEQGALFAPAHKRQTVAQYKRSRIARRANVAR